MATSPKGRPRAARSDALSWTLGKGGPVVVDQAGQSRLAARRNFKRYGQVRDTAWQPPNGPSPERAESISLRGGRSGINSVEPIRLLLFGHSGAVSRARVERALWATSRGDAPSATGVLTSDEAHVTPPSRGSGSRFRSAYASRASTPPSVKELSLKPRDLFLCRVSPSTLILALPLRLVGPGFRCLRSSFFHISPRFLRISPRFLRFSPRQ